MTKTFKLLTLVPLFACCFVILSCTSGPLEGDWFPCKDEACTRLDDDGVRFSADDRWGILEAPGSTYDPGESYELQPVRGDYSFDGSSVTLYADGTPEQITMRVEFEGDDLILYTRSTTEHACSAGPDGVPTCEPPKQTTEEKPMRFVRVADPGSVPVGPVDWGKKGQTPPKAPDPAPAPPRE